MLIKLYLNKINIMGTVCSCNGKDDIQFTEVNDVEHQKMRKEIVKLKEALTNNSCSLNTSVDSIKESDTISSMELSLVRLESK